MPTQETYTPGPWFSNAEGREGEFLVTTIKGVIVASSCRELPASTCRANARLIAAAPALLAALRAYQDAAPANKYWSPSLRDQLYEKGREALQAACGDCGEDQGARQT